MNSQGRLSVVMTLIWAAVAAQSGGGCDGREPSTTEWDTSALVAADDDGAGREICHPVEEGRRVLGPGDGWASLGTGTTGGALALPEQIYVVRSRAELIAALNDGVPSLVSAPSPSNQPKIIYVHGDIDFNVDDDNIPLTCADYQRDGFDLTAFAAAFVPAVWGRGPPTGPLETARINSRNAQQDRVRIRVGSNTTLVGLNRNARLRGVWLDVRGTANVPGSRTNIIIRGITFQDTHDCFPQWSPTDGVLGSWNALYDSISLREADHVWIDGNTFQDRLTADPLQPYVFGVPFQVHDGLLDITNGSDLITVSRNRFRDHDKVMLIGSSDSATADRGKLRVTLHHNLFERVGQRAPRVRFGQVHVYNNLYRIGEAASYVYSWGVGIESAIYAENNYFDTGGLVSAHSFIQRFNGTGLFETGTLVDDRHETHDVDVVAEWNAANDPDLTDATTWAPVTPAELIQPSCALPEAVRSTAGRSAWRSAPGGDRSPGTKSVTDAHPESE